MDVEAKKESNRRWRNHSEVDSAIASFRNVYSVKGHVLGVSKPHIQVLVDEEGPGGSKGKKLLMRYSLFASAGILEEGMPFRFRVYEQGNRVISEVVPIEGALRRLDPDVEAEVSRIEEIEQARARSLSAVQQRFA